MPDGAWFSSLLSFDFRSSLTPAGPPCWVHAFAGQGQQHSEAPFSRLIGTLPRRRDKKSPVKDRTFDGQLIPIGFGSITDVHLTTTCAEFNLDDSATLLLDSLLFSEPAVVRNPLREEGVLQHFPDAVILRPSVIFGPEDQFFNRFASMARLSPVLPLIGADSKFQPVYVDDVAKVAELAVLGRASGGIYELGGPDVASFKSLMERMLTVIQRKSILLPLPFFLGRLMASAFDTLQSVSLGLLKNGVVTRDQIKNLARDNVVSGGHKTFADLGIEPTALDAVLADYLWCYRPSGQFAAIKDSAKNLRSSS